MDITEVKNNLLVIYNMLNIIEVKGVNNLANLANSINAIKTIYESEIVLDNNTQDNDNLEIN